jgi:histidyl-tRNA synthetase
MRDFLPSDVRRREYVIGVIRDVYERYGFEPLETPAVENIETLTGKYGEEGNQLIFKILKRGEHEKTGEADLALRYDLTVPLARVVAEYGDKLPKFFKRYQIQPVWRADRPARGRFREFYQCDVDAIGSRSMIVEAEICAAAGDALNELGFANFTIRLNHRQVLADVLERAGVATEKHADALVALDKLDKIGAEGVAKELLARGVSGEAGVMLLRFFEGIAGLERASDEVDVGSAEEQREAYNAAVLGRLVEFVGDNEAGARGVDELRQILQFAHAAGVGNRIKLDPSLARGLSYYTGAIMEIGVPDLAGSLGGGGRYDNLVGMFSKQSIPACGFSLGLERIIVVMNEREMFPAELVKTPADVLVTLFNHETVKASLSLANKLRNEGQRVLIYPEPDKLGRQFKYASLLGIPLVAVIGPEESEYELISLKDMRTGSQEIIMSPSSDKNLPDREGKKAQWERDVFIEFYMAANLPVDSGSLKNEKFPRPDLSCSIEGKLHYFELVEITDEDVARKLSIALKTMRPTGGAFSQTRPLINAFEAKSAKPYSVGNAPLELLAYYDKQYPPTDDLSIISKTVEPMAARMVESGQWSRVWIYDRWNKTILWVYPNAGEQYGLFLENRGL